MPSSYDRIALTTCRLLIEPLEPRDVDDFVRYRRDPDVARYQSWGIDYSRADAERLVAAQPGGRLPRPAAGCSWPSATPGRAGSSGTSRCTSSTRSPTRSRSASPWRARHRVVASPPKRWGRCWTSSSARSAPTGSWPPATPATTPSARLLTRIGFRRESRQVEADRSKGEWITLDGYALLARERHARPL
ncbi:GNAT family N-acetyltransferase [Clavibacter tessellarius]